MEGYRIGFKEGRGEWGRGDGRDDGVGVRWGLLMVGEGEGSEGSRRRRGRVGRGGICGPVEW